MRRILIPFLFFVLVLTSMFLIGTPSQAEPSCVEAAQPDGTTWKTCVGDDGRMYCESCINGVCSRVSCSN